MTIDEHILAEVPAGQTEVDTTLGKITFDFDPIQFIVNEDRYCYNEGKYMDVSWLSNAYSFGDLAEQVNQKLASIGHLDGWAIWKYISTAGIGTSETTRGLVAAPQNQETSSSERYEDWAVPERQLRIEFNGIELIARYQINTKEHTVSSEADTFERNSRQSGLLSGPIRPAPFLLYNRERKSLWELVKKKAWDHIKAVDGTHIQDLLMKYETMLEEAEDGIRSSELSIRDAIEQLVGLRLELERAESNYGKREKETETIPEIKAGGYTIKFGPTIRPYDPTRVDSGDNPPEEEATALIEFKGYTIKLPDCRLFTISCFETGKKDAEKVREQIIEQFKLPKKARRFSKQFNSPRIIDYVKIETVDKLKPLYELMPCPYHPKKEQDQFIRPPTNV